jgi:hypothetical protein
MAGWRPRGPHRLTAATGRTEQPQLGEGSEEGEEGKEDILSCLYQHQEMPPLFLIRQLREDKSAKMKS